MAEKIEILAAYWNELLNNQTIKRKHPHTPRGAIEKKMMKKKKKNDEKRERNGEKSKKKTSKNETITTKKNEEKRKLPRIYAADDSVTLGVWQNEHYACISGARMMRAANIICRFTCLHCCVLRHYLHAKWLQLLCKFIACRLHRRHSLFDCNFVWLYPTIYSNSR